jgi:hypothetical protein
MWPSSQGIKIVGRIGIALENQMILMPATQILALSRWVWYTKNGRQEKPREGNTSGNSEAERPTPLTRPTTGFI